MIAVDAHFIRTQCLTDDHDIHFRNGVVAVVGSFVLVALNCHRIVSRAV